MAEGAVARRCSTVAAARATRQELQHRPGPPALNLSGARGWLSGGLCRPRMSAAQNRGVGLGRAAVFSQGLSPERVSVEGASSGWGRKPLGPQGGGLSRGSGGPHLFRLWRVPKVVSWPMAVLWPRVSRTPFGLGEPVHVEGTCDGLFL